jgi:hypothetical protein
VNELENLLKRQQDRAVARLAENPGDRMAKLLAHNREQAIADLHAEQRLNEARKAGELVELRLHGPRVDRGAIPMDAFLKVTSPFMKALRAIAERQRFGTATLNNKFKRLTADSLNIKLAGIGVGSTRLMLTGNGVADTLGHSLLHLTLGRMLTLLNAPNESFYDAVDTVGVSGARALGEFAGAVEAAGMAAELTWPFGDTPLHWEGRPDELMRIKTMLQTIEQPSETEMDIEGEVAGILDTGRLLLRVQDLGKVNIKFSLDKTHLAQQLVIRKMARLRVLRSTYWDPVKQAEVAKYHLL